MPAPENRARSRMPIQLILMTNSAILWENRTNEMLNPQHAAELAKNHTDLILVFPSISLTL